MSGQKKYDHFVEIFKKAHPNLTKQSQYKKAQELWKNVKGNDQKLENIIVELKAKEAKTRSSTMNFWAKVVSPPPAKISCQELTNQKSLVSQDICPSSENSTQNGQCYTFLTIVFITLVKYLIFTNFDVRNSNLLIIFSKSNR